MIVIQGSQHKATTHTNILLYYLISFSLIDFELKNLAVY